MGLKFGRVRLARRPPEPRTMFYSCLRMLSLGHPAEELSRSRNQLRALSASPLLIDARRTGSARGFESQLANRLEKAFSLRQPMPYQVIPSPKTGPIHFRSPTIFPIAILGWRASRRLTIKCSMTR